MPYYSRPADVYLAEQSGSPGDAGSRRREYVVVARRYRPQTFDELVGQEHVAKALSNAISTHRVGHAYLFTGARGVGKTSAARILAKALNCQKGPTPVPCNECDICQRISAGDDVDVLEIDGASNRGIDEIRQLRQNVNVRPSRERFKIYIIDEVHMLTREAFNALLKTLEEPPEHVKFIFCTTEPTKIPVTILSRCQRFDFAGIQTRGDRQAAGADRRGGGGRRRARGTGAPGPAGRRLDARQPVALGATAGLCPGPDHGGRRRRDARHRRRRPAGRGWCRPGGRQRGGRPRRARYAVHEGVDPGLLIEQLLGFYRDMMLAAVGCSERAVPPTPRASTARAFCRGPAGRPGKCPRGDADSRSGPFAASLQHAGPDPCRAGPGPDRQPWGPVELGEVIAALKSGSALPEGARVPSLPAPSGESVKKKLS